MNIKLIIVSLCAGSLTLTGCSKKEEPAPAPAKPEGSALIDSAKQAGQNAVNAAKDAGQAVADKAKEVGQQVGDAAKTALSGATDSATAKYQEVMAKAQSLLKDAKYDDALNSLKSLADARLTPDQQKTINDLKAQIEKAWQASKAAGSSASDAVKGLLKK